MMLYIDLMKIKSLGELQEWVQSATEGYEEVVVKDFTHSWKNGMAFSAIIDRHR